jgi:signal transduction histidine kinase
MRETSPTAARGPDGRLWFATLGGVAVVDPAVLETTPTVRAPVLVGLVIDGREHPVGEATSFRAPRGRGQVQLRYALPHFGYPRRVRLAHRLDGVDPDWVDASPWRTADYVSLPPGQHVFSVAAYLPHAPQVRADRRLTLTLVPPLQQRGEVWAGTAALVVALLLGAHRLRLWQQRQRHAAVLAERNRIARDLHDNLEQSLVGIKLHLEAAGGAADLEGSRVFLGRAVEAARDLKTQVRSSIWALRSALLSEAPLTTALPAGASLWLRGSGVHLVTTTEGRPFPLGARVENELLRIAQEAVTNVLKHAEARRVTLSLVWTADELCLRITDDGRGLGAGEPGGMGLVGMRERAMAAGGTLTVSPGADGGTVVEARVPRPRADRLWRRFTRPGASS